jgi:hypothetical protein
MIEQRPNVRRMDILPERGSPAGRIQVDMFDVQLGAALLIQFRNSDGEVVRVLADAGVDPRSGYLQNHTLAPLKQAMRDFDGGSLRIDLMIGTHYDADHLEGFIPIIADHSIEITEAWMPPVANDTEPHALEDQPQEDRLLAKQFDSENGDAVLRRYFGAKHQDCEQLQALQRTAEELAENRSPEREHSGQNVQGRFDRRAQADWIERERDAFKSHFDEAAMSLGESQESYTHADDDIQIPPDLVPPGFASSYDQPNRIRWWDDHWLRIAGDRDIQRYWSQRRDRAAVDARGLALLRKSTAKDAINAASLCKVVTALRLRKIPIECRIIDNGLPRRFVWRRDARRFVEGIQLLGTPELTLLGPSRGLVRKHCGRLPIGDYARLMFALLIPSKSIKPSNQLSYVLRLGFERQGMLVSGDAGCVDFALGRGSKFHKTLLDALLPLHVIQVAHYGGNNAQFYNVLLSAQYATQPEASRLLLSHATNDADRPSDLFAQFVAAARKSVDNVQVLFTSRPRDAYVRDYLTLIAPAIGAPKPAGDIRLVFDGRSWAVKKHAVQVP